MRLSDFEKRAISESASKYLKSPYELLLYGSRVDDNQRGGDIDLLILLQNEADRSIAQRLKIQILIDIKNKIGDQKIDLVIDARSQLGKDPFLDLIYPGALRL